VRLAPRGPASGADLHYRSAAGLGSEQARRRMPSRQATVERSGQRGYGLDRWIILFGLSSEDSTAAIFAFESAAFV
jgi:hypothetical protein